MNIQIEALKRKDISIIPTLIKSGINEEIFPLTIFSSEGYEEYVKQLIKIPKENRRVQLYGAFVNGDLAGYTEWRIHEDELFLNNIYVFPKYQGHGIGKLLLVEHGHSLLHLYGKLRIILDVFDNNTKAMKWYESIGFRIYNSTYWYIGEQKAVKPSADLRECYIENYSNAEAEQKAYGFSTLLCSTKSGHYHIGRINNQFYRLTNLNAFVDQDLRNCLYQLDSGRKLLILTNEDFSNHCTLACKSNRMHLLID